MRALFFKPSGLLKKIFIYALCRNNELINMEEGTKYFCQNCGSKIKSTDTICPKCGKNLKEVGRKVEVTVVDAIGLSDRVDVKLTKEQIKTIEKIYRSIKDYLASREIDSITIGFPQLISIKIKSKKDASKEKG